MSRRDRINAILSAVKTNQGVEEGSISIPQYTEKDRFGLDKAPKYFGLVLFNGLAENGKAQFQQRVWQDSPMHNWKDRRFEDVEWEESPLQVFRKLSTVNKAGSYSPSARVEAAKAMIARVE